MIRGLFALVVGAGTALGASQFPAYVQDYSQRLGGAVDALRPIVEQFDEAAADAGMTRQAALERYERSGDDFLTTQGQETAATIRRYETLADAKQELDEAGPFGRLMVFVQAFDPEIAERTATDFEPAVPATSEGAVHAGAGLLAGLLAGRGLWAFFAMPFRRRRASA